MKFINIKGLKFFLVTLFIVLVGVVFVWLGVDDESYALESNLNYRGDYILNPEWVEYMDLSEEEKALYDVIPEKFIYRYKKSSNKFKLFSFRSNNIPEYYNLNDYGLSTFPDNQGGLGICWAFASMSSVETNMLKTGLSDISDPVRFSVRQIDYVSVHHNYISEGLNPYYVYGRTTPGSGAIISTAFILMETGISPVTTDIYGEFNENTAIKTVGQTFNLDDVEYVIDSYVNYGSTGEYTTDSEREAWVNEIKNHVMNYGSVMVGTIGPLPGYAGSCIYRDTANSNYMLNVRGECNPATEENGHAMAIIGWDDNYEYEYCRLDDETTNNLTNCDNIVSGKGAFILKNSWGDFYPYPYFAYTSNVNAAYGVTGVSLKNWDTNYDVTKVHDYSYEQKISTVTYYKSSKVKEKLKKISFYSNMKKELTYDVYVSSDGSSDYVKVGSVIADKIGLNSIFIDDDFLLEGDKFSIKITSLDGYVDNIYAFTEDVDVSDDIIIDTVIKSGDEYGVNVDSFEAYTVTKNVPNGGIVRYRLMDDNGNDVTDVIDIYNNLNLNDEVNSIFEVVDVFPKGKLTFQTIYNGELYDSDEIYVSTLKNLWSGGSGSVDDPFLISNADDFVKIFTNQYYLDAHYKLIDDIDFSDIEDWNAGSLSGYLSFRGSLDGDNHVISGLNGDNSLMALFYRLENATIKNLIFSDIELDIIESGWGSVLSNIVYDSVIENVVITKSVNISGSANYASGLVNVAYNSEFINIANYGSISTDYAYGGSAGGIVGEAYSSIIRECYNYGDIVGFDSYVGGIVGYLGNDMDDSSIGMVRNVYNFGNIVSNYYSGGIAGLGISTIVDSVYNVYSNDVGENIGNIVGEAYGMVIKNSYYLSSYGEAVAINVDDSSTLVNVIGKNQEQLKDRNTYLNFDFDTVWDIDGSYPYFKDFEYFYLNDIEVVSELTLDVGEVKKIEVKYIPDSANKKLVGYEVVDNSIISISEDGNVTALKEGNTILKVYTLDGSDITKNISITVILEKVNFDEYEIIDESYIKIDPLMSRENFINSIDSDKYDIKVSGDSEYISTGDRVEVYDKEGNLVSGYDVIILGDVTGTGSINVSDVAKLYQYIKEIITMEEVFVKASDVVNDMELKINDVAKLYQYVKKNINSLEE